MNYRITNIGKLHVNRRVPLLLILFVTIVSFLPSLTNGFQMEWDDQWMVVNPFSVRQVSWDLLVEIFTTPFNGQWGPLNQMMYTILYSIWGFNPFVFHLASLAIHVINILLVYILLNRLLTDCTHLNEDRRSYIVYFTVCLFAVHPLQVESVAWISASKILMYTTFYLSSAYVLIIFLKKGGIINYVCVHILFLLSYFCKEQSVVFPLFATLIVLWYNIRLASRKFWLILTPLYITSLIMCLHEIYYVANYHLYIQNETYNCWQRMIFSFYSLSLYFFKWLAPIKLNWMYNFPFHITEEVPLWLCSYPFLMCVVILSFWKNIVHPMVISSVLFTIVHLLLVLHIVVLPRGAIVADRYFYLSIVGANFILAYYITSQHFIQSKVIQTAIAYILIGCCVVVTFNRTQDWADSKTLKNTHITNPKYNCIDTEVITKEIKN